MGMKTRRLRLAHEPKQGARALNDAAAVCVCDGHPACGPSSAPPKSKQQNLSGPGRNMLEIMARIGSDGLLIHEWRCDLGWGRMTVRASASENETNQTGQRREQVRGLPGHRFCSGQTAGATWSPDLSAAMCEVPRLGPDQEDRRLNARKPLATALRWLSVETMNVPDLLRIIP